MAGTYRGRTDWTRSSLVFDVRLLAFAVVSFLHPGVRSSREFVILSRPSCPSLICRISTSPVGATLADFELAYAENRGEFNKALGYATESPESQRQSVIAEVAKLLGPDSFRMERGRLSGMSLDAIKQRRDQIKLKQQLNPHSAQDIREGLAEFRAQQRPSQKVLPAEWTKVRLMDPSTSAYAIKHLIRVYGATAVNNRLMNRG